MPCFTYCVKFRGFLGELMGAVVKASASVKFAARSPRAECAANGQSGVVLVVLSILMHCQYFANFAIRRPNPRSRRNQTSWTTIAIFVKIPDLAITEQILSMKCVGNRKKLLLLGTLSCFPAFKVTQN